MEMVMMMFDTLTVFANLDDGSQLLHLLLLLLLLLSSMGIVILIAKLKVMDTSAAQRSVSVGSMSVPVVAGSAGSG